jgi:uroporphyrin-III C-methyltransferase
VSFSLSDPQHTKGFVSLVGAGPGNPDLLTLRGFKALRQAEVILYDALLDEAFQALFPSEAQAIFVGKRCGDDRGIQNAIHRLLIHHARAGKRVVRLKGGDPFIFGRGGEELLALAAAKIPFEVIPGLSALNGAGAAALIPLTHRGLSREIRIVEGHQLLSEERDWNGLAQFEGTLVVFMGKAILQSLAQRLIEHGAPKNRPLALVENASLPNQVITRIRLGEAAIERIGCTQGPGIAYIGPTAAFPDLLASPDHAFDTEFSYDHLDSLLPRSLSKARASGGRRLRRAG